MDWPLCKPKPPPAHDDSPDQRALAGHLPQATGSTRGCGQAALAFTDPLLLAAGPLGRHLLCWVTAAALIDSPAEAGRLFTRNATRVAKRRARRWLPSVVPESWGE